MGRLLMSPCCERISPYDHAAAEGNLKMFTFAENGKRSEQSMEKETALPKNIRQIGEVRGEEKICLEDYVMTCIHKKEQQEKEGYLGIFFGERRREAETEYVFIRGILELSKTWEPESFAEKLEKQRTKYFPDWTVQGCCVIGVYDMERIREVRTRIEDAGHIVYHLQEQEETLYAQRDGTYHKIKGYFIFYEQNRKMQAYLSDEFKEDRVEKESFPDRAIKSFREKVRIKSERKSGSMLKMASSFFVVTVLAVAAVTVTKMDDLKKVRQTLNASDNAAENEAQDHIYMDTAGMGENTNTPAGDSSGVQNTGMPDSENSGGMPESTTVSGGQSSVENTAGEEQSSVENTAATAIADESGAAAGSIGADRTESASDAVAGGNMTASNGLAAAQSSVSSTEDTGDAEESITAGDDGQTAGTASVQGDDTLQSASARPRRTQATYTIREGDTLADICSKYYGSFDKLELICNANGITDANQILPGQEIVLP